MDVIDRAINFEHGKMEKGYFPAELMALSQTEREFGAQCRNKTFVENRTSQSKTTEKAGKRMKKTEILQIVYRFVYRQHL